ncbi:MULTISPECIES: cysteine desulfurase family protein [Thermoactinomyces]|jgi:cysteine desulfurase|uniref:cysteine desulfurase n=1 Tax=Thermoactinomyces vulgaris TaxID=2026 RepID=A0ABS0QGX2_THEVU|nr:MULTISPECIES: cysteine desulfurase family protein [Thermoactinomyces]KFZ41437.1 cysteine desulfurase [Thermoactinomyces sp. Gus2-1]KYQ86730.1 cysteine desulfurase NifS [Thermoactinomyces sp. AS95]MBA4550739.1 cysteine desulfurase [Thermoactinomyces vulgaris]MBA4596202.1 cysteine desulfurase [Thermoactinomyces vulgaris]MBH8588515.1 cysteine desulfurase [Thermoactinomyces vulgaris]
MPIYLDHAATTPIHPKVKEAMLPFLDHAFGNPSSIHQYGREVRSALDRARDQIAQSLNADSSRIVFTSGGTEADNLALFGVMEAERKKGRNHLITSQIEHHAVLDTCHYLERNGFEVTYLPVDSKGLVDLEALKEATRPDTALVSIMYGNNEVGTLQPVREIGEWARERGIFFHTDAVQAFGVEEIDVKTLPVDLVTISSHKINGPKGAGALYFAPEVPLIPRFFGGAQERRRRAGTENVLGIVGFGKAAEIAGQKRREHRAKMEGLRKLFLKELQKRGTRHVINGDPDRSLPHIVNVSFPGTDSETLLMNFDLEGIACASGSACTSGTLEVSHVLKAMNLPDEVTKSAIRFSFGWENTEEEVRQAAQITASVVERLTSV